MSREPFGRSNSGALRIASAWLPFGGRRTAYSQAPSRTDAVVDAVAVPAGHGAARASRGADPRGHWRQAHLPAPTGSTVMVGALLVTGMLMPRGMVCGWVSLGGVITALVNVTPLPPELFGG